MGAGDGDYSKVYYAAVRRDGEVVATFRILGNRCGHDELLLRAGWETAETAPERVESAHLMRHDSSRPLRLHTWWQNDDSREHYFGHAYGSSWSLPPGCDPEALLVASRPGTGSIEVREIAVSSATNLR